MGGLGWVEGTIADDVTLAPIAGARVTVAGGYQSATTEADGSYRLTLPVGPATLHVEAFGYGDVDVAVDVYEDLTTTQNIAMGPLASATLSGTVHLPGSVPPTPSPAAGVSVRIADAPLAAVTTGADGRFSFSLPVGADYQIQASLSGQGALSQTVPVHGDLDVDLYLGALIAEDFETGDFTAMPWALTGNANWYVQSQEVHSGDHAARSGAMTHNQSCHLSVTVDCGAGGELSFWYKVSSEANYDYLQFFIDGGMQAEWAGEVGWAQFTTTVPAGEHTFRWTYDKDYSVSNGSDCGWVDDIVFPGGSAPVPLAVAAPWVLDGGVLADGQQVTLPLLVMNQGSQPLDFDASSPAGFVDVADGSAIVPANGYHLVQVTLDATGLLPGLHTGQVIVASNDPANPFLYVDAQLEVTGDTTPVEDAPRAFALAGAVPNPFNPQTTVHFTLPAAGHATLRLYDVQGRLVRTLVDGARAAGPNEVRWDGRDQHGRASASGTYFARLQFSDRSSVKSLVLVR
jgi:hypothetical protein